MSEATHPGDHIKAFLEEHDMSLGDLSRAANLSKAYLSDVVRHRRSVGVKTALRLERVFGVEAHVWLSLQAEWDLSEARRNDARGV